MNWARCALLWACLAGGAAQGEWERVEPGRALAYPRDHGAHLDQRTEWWYATGQLEGEDGRRFGFQFTVFRSGLAPAPPAEGASPWRARHVLSGHLVVCDVGSGEVRRAERLRRLDGGLARASERDLELALDDWSLVRQADGALALRAADALGRFGLELELAPEKALVLHAEGGVSRKGPEPGNASLYASWTRLATGGTLELDGRAQRVQGLAWFDHEFGTSVLGAGAVGWDWFGLHLDDGRDLMVFGLRTREGRWTEFSAGTLVAADGAASPLGAADFALSALASWKSPRTEALYPARWRIAVPAHGLELDVRPLVADMELDMRETTGVVYWEGPVAVSGSHAGAGYAELVGYAGSLAGRF